MARLQLLLPFVTLAVVAMAVPVLGSSYGLSFAIQVLVFVVLGYSWNLIGGYAGYTHFGQMSFFGIGAYVGSLLVLNLGVHWLLAALAAGAVGALVALPLGGAMLRLRGPFFAIGMFGLTRVFESFALGFDGITQGGTGLYLPAPDSLMAVYAALAVLAFVLLIGTAWLDNSRLGLRLLTIREDETAAEALGIHTARLKIAAFVASAVAPAATGALYATYLGYIDPVTAFSPAMELTTIATVLLGGMGTVLGPLVGALGLSVVNELLWSSFPELYSGLVGLLVIGAVLFMPRGIVGLMIRRRWLPVGRSTFRRMAVAAELRSRDPAQTPDRDVASLRHV